MAEQATATVLEEAYRNVQKATETSLKLQQEMMRQWTTMWPGLPTPQTVWIDKVKDFQREWSKTVSELAHKHKSVVDRQYQAALDSLDEALRFSESKDPEELRRRSEQLCKKTLECVREASEAQVKEFQDAMNKWTELVTKAGG